MDDICELKHAAIDKDMATVNIRLNNHSERIDKLESAQSATTVEIRHLCEQIKSLVSAIKWLITTTVTLLAGFFIWYIQNL